MIILELTIEEVNVILASLQKQPYEFVAPLIVKIKTEGDKQFEEQINPSVAKVIKSKGV